MWFKPTIVLLAAQVVAGAAIGCECAIDSCIRDILVATKDCSAALVSTVVKTITPAAITVATTTAVTTVIATVTALNKRQAAAPAVPAYAKGCAAISQYQSACSCLGVAKATITTTTTITAPTVSVTASVQATVSLTTTTRAPAPTACNNLGMNYAVQRNTASYANSASQADYPTFDPASLKLSGPLAQGTTRQIGFYWDGSSNKNLYSSPIGTSAFAVNINGYIYAGETGVYTFGSRYADNILFLWTGSKAVTAYTRANIDYKRTIYEDSTFNYNLRKGLPISADTIFKVTLTAGTYLPFRIIVANGGLPAATVFDISDPSGNSLVTDVSPLSTKSFIVRFSCDNTAAKPFPSFGSER